MGVFLRDALSREAVAHPPKMGSGGGGVGGVSTTGLQPHTHRCLTSLAEQSLFK